MDIISIKYINISIKKFTHAAKCIVSLHLDIRTITFLSIREKISESKTKLLLLVIIFLECFC